MITVLLSQISHRPKRIRRADRQILLLTTRPSVDGVAKRQPVRFHAIAFPIWDRERRYRRQSELHSVYVKDILLEGVNRFLNILFRFHGCTLQNVVNGCDVISDEFFYPRL